MIGTKSALPLVVAAFVLIVTPRAVADDRFSDGERTFARVRQLVSEHYYEEQPENDQAWLDAASGVLSHGGKNKWDRLLSPSDLAALRQDLKGDAVAVGIGIEIGVDGESGIISVLDVVPGSSADREGICPGDTILKLDGHPLKGMSTSEVSRLSAGKAGTSIKLTISRDGETSVRTVRRAAMVLLPVTDVSLPGELAFVRIHVFNEKTPELLRAALKRSVGARGLILDLRDNPGGLYEKMLECADEILPKGKLVATLVERGGHATEYRTHDEPLVTLPIAVLVDSDTASSAELFAEALRQHAGARLVGKHTYGKWNVQRIESLPNGWAAKITFGVFRSAGGELLDGKGLEPDVAIDLEARPRLPRSKGVAARLAADKQLRAAVALLRPH